MAALKEMYISPDLEVVWFVSAQRLASDPLWQNEGSQEEIPDVSVPGTQIPGWGN